MADLDFDPLFDASMPDDQRAARPVEKMPSAHKKSRLEEKRHAARQVRDASFGFLNKLIGIIGFIACIAAMIAVAYFGWKAAGF